VSVNIIIACTRNLVTGLNVNWHWPTYIQRARSLRKIGEIRSKKLVKRTTCIPLKFNFILKKNLKNNYQDRVTFNVFISGSSLNFLRSSWLDYLVSTLGPLQSWKVTADTCNGLLGLGKSRFSNLTFSFQQVRLFRGNFSSKPSFSKWFYQRYSSKEL